jgi:hypothetical protein
MRPGRTTSCANSCIIIKCKGKGKDALGSSPSKWTVFGLVASSELRWGASPLDRSRCSDRGLFSLRCTTDPGACMSKIISLQSTTQTSSTAVTFELKQSTKGMLLTNKMHRAYRPECTRRPKRTSSRGSTADSDLPPPPPPPSLACSGVWNIMCGLAYWESSS